MVYESNVRRILLAPLSVVWLSVQTLVIGISPAWGFLLPHGPITRGFLGPAAWAAHLREHQLGYQAANVQPCRQPPDSGGHVIASTLDTAGAFSFITYATLSLQDGLIEIPAPDLPHFTLGTKSFYVSLVVYPPLDPPPTV